MFLLFWNGFAKVLDCNSTTSECKLIANRGAIICDVKQRKTIQQRTEKETSEKYLVFFDDSALTRVLNYFINYPATKNWGIFNKQSLVSLQLQCTGTKVNTISHFK